jgi:hypothetical protein
VDEKRTNEKQMRSGEVRSGRVGKKKSAVEMGTLIKNDNI